MDPSSVSRTQALFMSATTPLFVERHQVKRLGGELNLSQSQVRVENVSETVDVIPAQSVNAMLLQSSGAQMDFYIQPGNFFLKHGRICLEVTNNGATPAALLPVPYWFDRVEIWGNSGGLCLQSFPCSTGLFLDQFIDQPDEYLISVASAVNIDPTDVSQKGVSAALAAGATGRYILTLNTAFWENVPTWCNLKGYLTIRLISSRTGPFDVQAGADPVNTNVAVTNAYALVTIVNPSDEQIAHINQQPYRDTICLQQVMTDLSFQTLTPGGTATFRLANCQGIVPYMYLTFRGPTPFATRDLARNWVDTVANFQMLDGAGKQIVQQLNEDFASTILAADWWRGSVFSQLGGALIWCFSSSPGYTQKTGAVMGGRLFTGSEQIKIQCESTITAGNYEILAICSIYQIIRVTGGLFQVVTSV